MRRYPRIKRAGCPSSVLSCTVWGFSCLANYFASGELLPRLFTLARHLLPKNRRYLFCDTLRHRNFSTAMPACFTRHAAVWCSDFPPATPKAFGVASDHLPSGSSLSHLMLNKREPRITRMKRMKKSKRLGYGHEENRDHYERDK
jgi:hypothetical protein